MKIAAKKVAPKAKNKVPVKAPPPVKKAAPIQKVVKQAKAQTPPKSYSQSVAEKGSAVAAQVRPERNVASDLPVGKTSATVIDLPMTLEHKGVMKSTKLPEDTRVMRYHDATQWASCLMWVTYVEKEVVDPLPKKGQKAEKRTVRAPDAIHMIRTASDGSLDYHKLRPEESIHFAEIQGGYPIVPAVLHFRKHADTVGASARVREFLGMSKEAPVKTVKVVERNEHDGTPTGRVIEVPKPPKGGNSNKPTQNDDLDELYDRAARLLGAKVKDLKDKYKHLNNGLQAMNLRNRLRAKGHNV